LFDVQTSKNRQFNVNGLDVTPKEKPRPCGRGFPKNSVWK
jgi:hypothetical protein